MPTGTILFLLLMLVGLFIVIYKRHMLIKMFSLNIATLAEEFRSQMDDTADKAVKKLEHQMSQLEYLLEEADTKIGLLESRLTEAQNMLTSNTIVETAQNEIPVMPQQLSHGKVANKVSADVEYELQNLPPPAPLHDGIQDKRQQVITMYRQGFNVVEIAKATSMGKGEVMLLLELHKN